MKRLTSLLAMAVAPLLLSACFGGGSDDAPAPVDPLVSVPDSAVQSVIGTVDYLAVLNKTPSDTREPIDITAVLLPTSDTTEPQPLTE